MFAGGAAGVRRRRDRHALHHDRLVARRHQRGRDEGDHTRVVQISHRYGMILFIASEVMFFVAWFWAYFDIALFPADVHQVARGDLHRPRLAAARRRRRLVPRHLRSLASAAAQHADPADLGHHGDLGASRAAARRPQGPDQRPVADHPARRHLHLRAGLRIRHAAFNYSGHIYGATFFMATGFHGAHVLIGIDLPDRVPDPRLRRALHADPASRLRILPPGTGTSSTWCGCSCSPASMCGAAARRSHH